MKSKQLMERDTYTIRFLRIEKFEKQFREKFEKAKEKLSNVEFDLKLLDYRYEGNEVVATLNVPTMTKRITMQNGDEVEVERSKKISRENMEDVTEITYIGTISIRKQTKQVYNATDNDDVVLSELDIEGRCDHCELNRKRKSWFVFREDGEIKVIGTSCSIKYFGYDVSKMIRIFHKQIKKLNIGSERPTDVRTMDQMVSALLKSIENEIEWDKGQFRHWLNLEDSLNPSTTVREEKQKYSQWKDQNRETIDMIKEQTYREVERRMNWNEKSDFIHNQINALFHENGDRRRYFDYNLNGIVGWTIFSVAEDIVGKEVPMFVGEVGTEMEMNVKVVNLSKFNSRYSDSGKGSIVFMEDVHERDIVWFSSKLVHDQWTIGQHYKIRANIKQHDEQYQSTKVNYVSQLKTLDGFDE